MHNWIVDANVEVIVEAIVVRQAMKVMKAIVKPASGFDHKHEARPGQTPEQAPRQTTKTVRTQ